MQINFEKILKHAEERLQRQAGTKTEDHLNLFKKFLKIENQRLKMWHASGGSGREVAEGRSHLVDAVIQHVFKIADEEYREVYGQESISCVVAALGGYGRRELNPFSDVDIMFLFPREMNRYVDVIVNKVLYMLWDVGFHVGHSVRSIADAIRFGRDDLVSRTAMMESRFLVGDKNIYDAFLKQFHGQVEERGKEIYLGHKFQEFMDRHQTQGVSAFVQEPDVKEGTGGLRDLHFILWVGSVLYGAATLPSLLEKKIISPEDYKWLSTAYDFLLKVRTELHYQAGKKYDSLTLDMQPKVARALGYEDGPIHSAVEQFMRDYFFTARDIERYVLLRAHRWLAEKEGLLAKLRAWVTPKKERDGFLFQRGEIFPSGPTIFQEVPLRLIRLFQYAQETGGRLSEELKDLIRNHLKFVSRQIQASPEARDIFLEILSHPGSVASTLRAMHDSGVLGKYLPEFGRLTCMVQYDFYHKYTTDEHILHVIDFMDEVAEGKKPETVPYHRRLNKVENPALLYFGLLMHDIGKGLGGGHSQKGADITVRVCQRLGLSADFTERARFLVDQHLTMAHLSQRRDLNDPSLISIFANTVKDKQNLVMLHLLTFCDGCGTGSKVWTQWKEILLWELFDRTSQELEEGAKSREKELLQAKQKHWDFIRERMNQIPEKQILDHFEKMPLKYIRYTPFDHIALHLDLVERVSKEKVAVTWREASASFSEVTVCTQDQPGLFYKIAGTLSLNQINILSASINTRTDGIILDAFQVCDRGGKPVSDQERQQKMVEDLKLVLSGELDLNASLQKELEKWERARRKPLETPHPKVKFDNFISEKFTVIDVQVEDRLGLLYTIAHTLSSLGLSIFFAKIGTEKNQAYDVFYVGDVLGKKIVDETRLKRIKETLEQELTQKVAQV